MRLLSNPTSMLIAAVAFAAALAFSELQPWQSPRAASQMPGPTSAAALSENVIDGRKQPNLIPDPTAYRLWFLSVAGPEIPTAQQQARERAVLRTAGLPDSDVPYAAGVLADFKSQFDTLVKQYNEEAERADKNGSQPDLQTFRYERDALVKYTRERLKRGLSAYGMGRLDEHVQIEKRGMLVAKEVQP